MSKKYVSKPLPPIKRWVIPVRARTRKNERFVQHWARVLRRWLVLLGGRASGVQVKRFNVRYWSKHQPDGTSADQLLPLTQQVQDRAKACCKFGFRESDIPDIDYYKKDGRHRLSDWYLKEQLAAQTRLRASDIPAPLIEAKRAHLRVQRVLKECRK